VCGALIGHRPGGEVFHVVRLAPLPNATSGDPRTGFAVSAEAQLHVERQARAEGLEVIGYYHSHPDGQAWPSELDREHASRFHAHLVCAVSSGGGASCAAFVIDGPDGPVRPLPVRSEGAAP
jgi:proteasome lid subunit RPN8/RPN11